LAAVVLAGYTVSFISAQALAAQLAKAHAENNLKARLTFFSKPKLLIIDEFGLFALGAECCASVL
jgi:DNA replication protein DnaC